MSDIYFRGIGQNSPLCRQRNLHFWGPTDCLNQASASLHIHEVHPHFTEPKTSLPYFKETNHNVSLSWARWIQSPPFRLYFHYLYHSGRHL